MGIVGIVGSMIEEKPFSGIDCVGRGGSQSLALVRPISNDAFLNASTAWKFASLSRAAKGEPVWGERWIELVDRLRGSAEASFMAPGLR